MTHISLKCSNKRQGSKEGTTFLFSLFTERGQTEMSGTEDEKELSPETSLTDEIPNAETLKAFAELDNGGGHLFHGTTAQLIAELLKN